MLRELPQRRRRAVIASVAAVIAVPVGFFAVTMLPASAAAVAPTANGIYTLVPGASGKCVNVTGASADNSALLVQAACVAGTTSQQWKAVGGTSGQYTLANVNSSRCIDVPSGSTTSGTQLQQYGCGDNTKVNQLWTFTASTATAGKYLAKSVVSGLCLSTKDGSTAGNNPIVEETCSDVARMQISFNYVSGPTGAPAPTPCTGPSTPAATTPPASTTINVWMAGDSTMANPGVSCPVGWGTTFDSLFHSNVVVNNLAVSGRSIQTWMYEGGVSTTKDSAGECALTSTTPSTNWQKTLNGMKAGDYLFIQFGINDGDTACPKHVSGARYQTLMTTMAKAAQAKGAFPILITPVAAIACSGSTATLNRGFYTETFAVGTALKAPVIDLRTLSVNYYNSLGLCPNDGNYAAGLVGQFFCNDHTHFEAYGANRIMRLVSGALKTQNIALAGSLL